MLTIRRAEDRGHANHGWLDSYHSFSFANYHDPRFMGFRSLRVINEDRVEAGQGFGTHPHRDMEIISYVLDGGLEHRDSMKNGSVIRPGDVQRMSAGTGVTHSEYNASQSDPVHFLQIWLIPTKPGLTPSYEQKSFSAAEKQGRLRLLASPEGEEGSVTVHANARVYGGLFDQGQEHVQVLAPGRHAWLQVVRGRVAVNGHDLAAGDGVSLSEEPHLRITGLETGEVIVFDLA